VTEREARGVVSSMLGREREVGIDDDLDAQRHILWGSKLRSAVAGLYIGVQRKRTRARRRSEVAGGYRSRRW
jgi:hypothetical protein